MTEYEIYLPTALNDGTRADDRKVTLVRVLDIREEIFPHLEKCIISDCPFSNLPEKKGSRWGEPPTAEKMKEYRWIKPELVCQIQSVEWTDSGKSRHRSFGGMRDGKAASKVVRET